MASKNNLKKSKTVHKWNFMSLPQMVFDTCKRHATKPLLFQKKHHRYTGITGRELKDAILDLANWLINQGVKPGDTCAILSENCPDWVIADQAIMAVGATVVPVYPTLSREETNFILTHSKSSVVFVDHSENAKKIDNPGDYKAVVCFSDQEPITKANKEDIEQVEKTVGTLKPDTVASIVYTSGTTGTPKGAMLTHGNFLSNVSDILEVMPLSEQERVLSFLPLSHVFERTAGYYTVMAIGGQIYYAESIESVGDNIRESHPTVVVSVPRLYEKIQAKILNGLKGPKKPIFYWALNVGRRWFVENKRSPGLLLKKKLAERLVFKKINKQTGGALRFFVSGGAPLAKEVGEFFQSLGLLIIEGYGMTETSPVVACNRPSNFKMGTIGKALPSFSVKLADDGELMVKGPCVMKGYLRSPKKTNDVLDKDGWLHTGDIATIDRQGFITIVDRKKEIIVLSNGKKVAPLLVEKQVGLSQYVAQLMVIGEKRNFITALIVPDFEKKAAIERIVGKSCGTEQAFCQDADIYQFFEQEIEKRQHGLSRYEKIKKFVLLPKEFTQEDGFLTPTLKPKRQIILKAFDNDIRQLYEA